MVERLRDFVAQFQLLTDEEIDLIVDNADIRVFEKGTLLLKEGQVCNTCYFVLQGCVREYYVVDGEEKSTAFFTEYDPVNAFTSATNQTPSRYYLECVEDCVLTVGEVDMVEEMVQRIPRLENVMRVEVERHAGKVQDDHAAFVMSSPEQRYLNLLEHRRDLIHRVPQHQLASFIGVTPESLSRIRKRILLAK